MKKPVITISREFGSGGREIGEQLAKKLGITLYDKTIINLVAEKSGYPLEFVEENDQRLTRSVLFQIAVTGSLPPWLNGPEENIKREGVFSSQAAVIKELAAAGGCVIVGRCADYILRNEPNCISVFIRGDHEDKVNRCVKEYGFAPNVAAGEMVRRDRERADHYTHYTERVWGNAENFDLCINSSMFGIDGCVGMIIDAISMMKK